MSLVGRIGERQRLDQLLTSVSAEFFAIYGRRRVGKTYPDRQRNRSGVLPGITFVEEKGKEALVDK